MKKDEYSLFSRQGFDNALNSFWRICDSLTDADVSEFTGEYHFYVTRKTLVQYRPIFI